MFKWYRNLKEAKNIPEEDKVLREELKKRSRNTTISINGDNIILNGRRLRPGSPEYKKAKKIVDNGMNDIGKQMGELGKEMGRLGRELGDDLKDMFKDFKL